MVANNLRPEGDINPEELRAGLGALGGPLRAAFGSSRPFAFAAAGPSQELARNVSRRPLYVEVRQTAGGAITLLLGPSQNLTAASNASYPTILFVAIPVLLYPGETLWGRDAAGAAMTLLVSEVSV